MNEVILSPLELHATAIALRRMAEVSNEDSAKELCRMAYKYEKATQSNTHVKLIPCVVDIEGKEVVF